MKTKVTALASALGFALGISAAGTQAAILDVVSWDLTDFNNDGLRSDFAFYFAPTGNSTNQFGYTPETGCSNAPGGNCVAIEMNGTAIVADVFTTGFNFGGMGDFKPNITAGGVDATIDTAVAGGQALQFSALNFGTTYPGLGGEQFDFPPDIFMNCSGGAGCGTFGNGYNVETLTDLGGGQYGLVVRYVGTIYDPVNVFFGNQANWRLEGIMTTAPVPLPAAAWLFVSGLLGLGAWTRRRR